MKLATIVDIPDYRAAAREEYVAVLLLATAMAMRMEVLRCLPLAFKSHLDMFCLAGSIAPFDRQCWRIVTRIYWPLHATILIIAIPNGIAHTPFRRPYLQCPIERHTELQPLCSTKMSHRLHHLLAMPPNCSPLLCD